MEEIIRQDHNVITYTDYAVYKHDLDTELQKSAEQFVRIGYLLKVAQDTGILAGSGYSNVNEFAMKEYGLDKTQVSRFIRINDRFSKDGYSMELKEEYQRFGYAKLALMLTLPDEINEILTPEMSKAEISAVKEEVEEEQKISDIEVMIEQEPETTRSAETTFEKALLNIFHDEPQLFTDVIDGMSGGQDIFEIMAPADIKVYMTRIPGIGKLAMSVNSSKKMIELVNMRSMEKEQITEEEIIAAIRDISGGSEDTTQAWEEIYHEKFPKTEKAKVAPVQRKESHVNLPKEKPKKQEKIQTLHDIDPDMPEPSPIETAEQSEERVASTDETLEAGEQQLPGQDSIENHPEYMPDEPEKEENVPEIKENISEIEENEPKGTENGMIDSKDIKDEYELQVSNYLNKLLKIWNSNALQKIDEMRWVVEKLDGILMNIKAKEIEDHMDELEEE